MINKYIYVLYVVNLSSCRDICKKLRGHLFSADTVLHSPKMDVLQSYSLNLKMAGTSCSTIKKRHVKYSREEYFAQFGYSTFIHLLHYRYFRTFSPPAMSVTQLSLRHTGRGLEQMAYKIVQYHHSASELCANFCVQNLGW